MAVFSSAAFLWKTGASAGSKRYHMLFTNPPLLPRTSMHSLRWNGSLCSITVLHIMTIKCIVFKTHMHTNSITFTDIYRTHEIENISKAVWLSLLTLIEMLLMQPKQTVCYFGVVWRLTFNQLTTLNSRALYFRAAYWFFLLFPVKQKQKLNIYRPRQRPRAKVKRSYLCSVRQSHWGHINCWQADWPITLHQIHSRSIRCFVCSFLFYPGLLFSLP